MDIDDFIRAARQAERGRVAILQFHGAPDTAHDWVSTQQSNFEAYMHYLATEKYQVIALRDLEKYQGTTVEPAILKPSSGLARNRSSNEATSGAESPG